MDTVTKRHPIRGFLYGVFFGLGLALIVVGQGMGALGTWPPLIVFVVGVFAATLWGIAGPVKAPKGHPLGAPPLSTLNRREILRPSSRRTAVRMVARSRPPVATEQPTIHPLDKTA